MSRLKIRDLILFFAFFCSVLWSVFAFSDPLEGKIAEPGRIVIESRTMEMDNQLKLVTFSGDVNAKRDDFVIDCDKMLVYYESMPAAKETQESRTKINRIVFWTKVMASDLYEVSTPMRITLTKIMVRMKYLKKRE